LIAHDGGFFGAKGGVVEIRKNYLNEPQGE